MIREAGLATVHRQVHLARLGGDGPGEALRLPQELSHPRLLTGGLYRHEDVLFLYTEWLERAGEPSELLGDPSARWSPWTPLVEVFHFNEPINREHWQRKVAPEARLGRVAFLRPEWVASYIYYHYQLQEERAFSGGKYESIYLWGTMLFQYKELPAVLEAPLLPGRLRTRGTPEPWSEARMDLHFAPWPDGSLYFKDAECLALSR